MKSQPIAKRFCASRYFSFYDFCKYVKWLITFDHPSGCLHWVIPAVEVSHFGGQKAWPKLVHVVAGAQRRIIRYLEEGLYEAPTRTTLGDPEHGR